MVGTLEPRKEADLPVVGGNPLENVAAVTRVQAVYVAGERVGESGVAPPPSGVNSSPAITPRASSGSKRHTTSNRSRLLA
jgi:hypothetical protein